MALKRHFPFQIDQNGATLNQVLYWDNTKWRPGSLSAIGGTSIYTGSGTIGAGVSGSTTNATLPAGNSAFNIRHFGGSTAILVQGNGVNSGTVNVQNRVGDYGFQVNDLDVTFLRPGGTVSLNSDGLIVNDTLLFLSTTLDTPDTKALFEISSTTKGLLFPRFDAGQFTTFIATATTAGMTLFDTATDTIKLKKSTGWVDLTDSSSSVTASNGLTAVGSDVRLGGTLSQDTTIANGGSFNLTLSGARSNGNLLSVSNTATSGANGVQGISAGGGVGILGQALLGGVAGQFLSEDTATNTVLTGASVVRNVTSGSGATGAGVRLEFGVETTTTVSQRSNAITSEWTTATHANRTSKLSISTLNSGTEGTKLELAGTGALKLNSYGAGTFTGTATKTLQVDGNGNVIEGSTTPAAGSGGIYGGSGTIATGCNATVASGSFFTLNYNNGAQALQVDDGNAFTRFMSRTNARFLEINNGNFRFSLPASKDIYFLDGSIDSGVPGLFRDSAATIDASAVIEGFSTTKGLLVPRMTTTKQNEIVSPANGLHIYNTTLTKHSFRENGAWVQYMADTAGVGGIYKGSGTVAASCVATVTASSSFRIAYSTGGNGAIQVSSTSGSENVLIAGQSSNYGRVSVTNSQATVLAGSSGQGILVTEGLTILNSNTQQIGKKVLFTAVNTPATFGAQQNDYDIGNNTHLRLETTVNDTIISGMTHGFGVGNFGDAEGRIVFLTNIGATNNIRLAGNNAGSQAEYRFITLVVLAPGDTVQYIYDSTSQRWRNVK